MEATMEMPATEQAANEQAAEQTTAPVDNAQPTEAAAPEATAAEATVEQPAEKAEATPADVSAPEPTPEEKNAKRITDLQAKIALQKAEVADRAVAVEEAKETAKSMAKSLDSAVEYLRDLQGQLSAAEAYTPEPLPLFDDPELRSAPATEQAVDESWRSLTLEQLGIKSPRVLSALQEHEPRISTFGELADWQNAKGDFWAKDIKGLGDVGREEIENAQLAYWTAHPQPQKSEATEQAATEPPTAAETPQEQTDPAAHVGSNGDGKAT